MNDKKTMIPGNWELRVMANRNIASSFKTFQKDRSFQKTATNASFCREMESVEGKDVLIVANYDIAYSLFIYKRLNQYLASIGRDFTTKFNYKSLTVVTDLLEVDANFEAEAKVVPWPLLMIEHAACLSNQTFDAVISINNDSFKSDLWAKVITKCNEWLAEDGVLITG